MSASCHPTENSLESS